MAQHKSGVNTPLWEPVCWICCIGLGLLSCLLLQLADALSPLYLLLNVLVAIAAAIVGLLIFVPKIIQLF